MYQKEYKRKLVSAEKFVGEIRDIVDDGFLMANQWFVYCPSCQKDELQDVQIFSAVTIPPVPEVAKLRGHFTYIDWQFSKVSTAV